MKFNIKQIILISITSNQYEMKGKDIIALSNNLRILGKYLIYNDYLEINKYD